MYWCQSSGPPQLPYPRLSLSLRLLLVDVDPESRCGDAPLWDWDVQSAMQPALTPLLSAITPLFGTVDVQARVGLYGALGAVPSPVPPSVLTNTARASDDGPQTRWRGRHRCRISSEVGGFLP